MADRTESTAIAINNVLGTKFKVVAGYPGSREAATECARCRERGRDPR